MTPKKLTAIPLIWVILASLFVLLISKAWFSGRLGHIGTDNDDIMRLIQIRDLYHGQSWFDLTQYRMGTLDGTLMHWSRLVDLPLVIIIGFFDFFLPYSTAEKIALSIWPPLTGLLLTYAIYTGCKNLADKKAAYIGALLSAFYIFLFNKFSPGAIDHHNIQIALLALSSALLLNPSCNPKAFLLSGIALGFAFAIAAEIYVLGVLLCAYVALLWVIRNEAVKSAAAMFGSGFGLTITGLFFVTIHPDNYLTVHCDALSFITISAGLAGGGGLAVLAQSLSHRSLGVRVIGLILLGVSCLPIFTALAPACLSNPLDSLPENVKELWLGNITEAQPLVTQISDIYGSGLPIIAVSILAIIVCIYKVQKAERSMQYVFLGFLITSGLILTLYQNRFGIFPKFLAFMPLAVWISELHNKRGASGLKSYSYILAIALAFPSTWVAAGQIFHPQIKQLAEDKTQMMVCYGSDIFTYLKSISPERVLVTESFAPYLLMNTNHTSLSGNYHRNTEGLTDAIQIWTSSSEAAERILRKQSIKLIHFCPESSEYDRFRDFSADSFVNDLSAKKLPDFLEIEKSLSDGKVLFLRLKTP